MPKPNEPKLSAVLNNCGLHALTPEITAEVLNYANPAHNNRYRKGYEKLKDTFASFYGLTLKDFSLNEFAAILTHYQENAFDLQMILGPVLREFSEQFVKKNKELAIRAIGQNMTSSAYIEFITKLNPATGRYESLAPEEIFSFIGSPLGLSITYKPQNAPEQLCKTEEDHIAHVHIFHQGGVEGAQAGGHYERTANGAGTVDYERQDNTQLQPFIELLEHGSPLNNTVFSLLKKHVKLVARSINEQADLNKELQKLFITSAHIKRYLFNIKYVSPKLAAELLSEKAPITAPITKYAQQFIDTYKFDSAPEKVVYEHAVNGFDPVINNKEDEAIIESLQAKILIPQVKASQVKAKPVVEHTKTSVPVSGDSPADTAIVNTAPPVSAEPLQAKTVVPQAKAPQVKAKPLVESPKASVPVSGDSPADTAIVNTAPPPKKTFDGSEHKQDEFNRLMDELGYRVINLGKRAINAIGTDQHEQLLQAHKCAAALHQFLKEQGNDYFVNGADYEEFRNKTTKKIEDALKILTIHRDSGLTRVLRIIVDFLSSLKTALFSGSYSFFSPTASSKTVEAIAESIDNAKPSP